MPFRSVPILLSPYRAQSRSLNLEHKHEVQRNDEGLKKDNEWPQKRGVPAPPGVASPCEEKARIIEKRSTDRRKGFSISDLPTRPGHPRLTFTSTNSRGKTCTFPVDVHVSRHGDASQAESKELSIGNNDISYADVSVDVTALREQQVFQPSLSTLLSDADHDGKLCTPTFFDHSDVTTNNVNTKGKNLCREEENIALNSPSTHQDSGNDQYDDSEMENDSISSNSSRPGFLSLIPYFRGLDIDGSSFCSDSTESASGTQSITNHDPPATPASVSGENILQGNTCVPHSAGTGSSANSNQSTLGLKIKQRPNDVRKKPLSLCCWYAAAGQTCPTKHGYRSPQTRYLWCDHSLGGTNGMGLNHRLPNPCQNCGRLFLTKDELKNHKEEILLFKKGIDDILSSKQNPYTLIESIRHLKDPCTLLCKQEIDECNFELEACGISERCLLDVENIRRDTDRQLKNGNIVSGTNDATTMEMLKQRVEANIQLYINESNTTEKTARSELWKWYLIFKRLLPSDEIPLTPFIAKRQLPGGEHAIRIFNCNIEQYCEEEPLTESQRGAVKAAFLATLEMLGVDEDSHKYSSRNSDGTSRKRQRVKEAISVEDPYCSTLAPLTPALPSATAASIATTPSVENVTYRVPGPIDGEKEMTQRVGMYRVDLSDFPGQESNVAIHDEETSQVAGFQPTIFPGILDQGSNAALDDDGQVLAGAGFVHDNDDDFSNLFGQHGTSSSGFSF